MADNKRTVFISHSHTDKSIADCVNDLFTGVFGDLVETRYSTKKSGEGGIEPGREWLKWVVEQIQIADVTLVLLTRQSIHKPWPMWEAGAVAGASQAKSAERPIIPMKFGVGEVPSPLSGFQAINGTSQSDLAQLVEQVFFPRLQASSQQILDMFKKFQKQVEPYLRSANEALLALPVAPDEASVSEWCERLDELRRSGRGSEASQLQAWIDVSFGARDEGKPAPIDIRIHRRLAQLYSNSEDYERAMQQFELCRQLVPRDLYILRGLGEVLTKKKDFARAKEVMDFVSKLDPNAFELNAEFAGLMGRYYKMQSDWPTARKHYERAMKADPNSFYLADNLGQACAHVGDLEGAKTAYLRVREVVGRLTQHSIWSQAALANAAIVLGEGEVALRHLTEVYKRSPAEKEIGSILEGLRALQAALGLPSDRFMSWERALRSGGA